MTSSASEHHSKMPENEATSSYHPSNLTRPTKGHCGVTAPMDASEYDPHCCGSKGSWPLPKWMRMNSKAAKGWCVSRCEMCTRCAHISLSERHGDCSWYADCDTAALTRFSDFHTYTIRRSVPSKVACRAIHSGAMGTRVIIWQRMGGDYIHANAPYMFEGAVRTLEEGFRAAEFTNVSRGFWSRGATPSLGPGDIFVWVGSFNYPIAGWQTLRDRGVRRIFYQTEPVNNCSVPARALATLIDEVWDFSEHNLESCRSMLLPSPTARVRHVPLGYLQGSAQPRRPRNDTGALFFFGNHLEPGRRPCSRELHRVLGRQRFHHRFDIFNDEDFVSKVLDQYNVFVNLHKRCGDRHNPVTFRVAKLLNAGKLVLSERSYAHDERTHEGAVLFVDSVTAAYQQLVREGDWAVHAAAAAAEFRRRFQPADLFQRAGVYADFGLRLRPSEVTVSEVRGPSVDWGGSARTTSDGGAWKRAS